MIYIELFHGRTNPNQEMDEWGFDGPILGPFTSIELTYCHSLKLISKRGERDDTIFFCTYDDLWYYDGNFYGDISIFDDFVVANHDLKPIKPDPIKIDKMYFRGDYSQELLSDIVPDPEKWKLPENQKMGLHKEGDLWEAWDNTSGDCFVEAFKNEQEALNWLLHNEFPKDRV